VKIYHTNSLKKAMCNFCIFQILINLLLGAGSVSHETATEKAVSEYKKYQQKTLSEAEKNYLESLKTLEEISKKEKRSGIKR
jgi:hypothetical protein